MHKKILSQVIALSLLLLLSAASIVLLSCRGESRYEMKPLLSEELIDTTVSKYGLKVGTGWGKGLPAEAVEKASDMAYQGASGASPDFVMVFPTAGSDVATILQELRQKVGEKTKIFGCSSDARGVMTDKGYIVGSNLGYLEEAAVEDTNKNALALMALKTQRMNIGLGFASNDNYETKEEMADAVILAALKDVGGMGNRMPDLILTFPTIGNEHALLGAIENAGLADVPLIGGTAAGKSAFVISGDRITSSGISIALIYTDLEVGWAYEGGYDRFDKYSGEVTKMDGRRILEIDHRGAFDVYNEWMEGEPLELLSKGTEMTAFRDYLSLHPVARIMETEDGRSYTVLSHPWAPNEELITSGLNTTTDIAEGDRLYLSYGTWEILLNRIVELPRSAKKNFDGEGDVLFSFAIICGGVLGTIPENERILMPNLINNENDGAPFIGIVTWGEQGQLPGIGNEHCNLTVGYITFRGPKE